MATTPTSARPAVPPWRAPDDQTGRIHAATPAVPAAAPFQAVFLFFAVTTAIGLAVYLLSQDRAD